MDCINWNQSYTFSHSLPRTYSTCCIYSSPGEYVTPSANALSYVNKLAITFDVFNTCYKGDTLKYRYVGHHLSCHYILVAASEILNADGGPVEANQNEGGIFKIKFQIYHCHLAINSRARKICTISLPHLASKLRKRTTQNSRRSSILIISKREEFPSPSRQMLRS